MRKRWEKHLENVSSDEWTRHKAAGPKDSPQLPLPSVFAGKAVTGPGEMERAHLSLSLAPAHGDSLLVIQSSQKTSMGGR